MRFLLRFARRSGNENRVSPGSVTRIPGSGDVVPETAVRVVGGRFADSVELAISHIRETPLAGREIEDGVRRQLTKVFPYAVLYSIEPDFILIVAVMHSHREPGYWRDRL